MDLHKIGQFIAMRRKEKGLTQLQLAERLCITDRAVSKWETGRTLPDAALMLSLCDILEITVNDLLSGEVVTMDNYNKEMENNLLEMVRQKEAADKRLLKLEIVMGILFVSVLVAAAVVAEVVPIPEWAQVMLILSGLLPLLIATPFMLKIEQTAGYYRCARCGHTYVPTYGSVFLAPHINRSRHMRCPQCGKRAWHKKVLRKDSVFKN